MIVNIVLEEDEMTSKRQWTSERESVRSILFSLLGIDFLLSTLTVSSLCSQVETHSFYLSHVNDVCQQLSVTNQRKHIYFSGRVVVAGRLRDTKRIACNGITSRTWSIDLCREREDEGNSITLSRGYFVCALRRKWCSLESERERGILHFAFLISGVMMSTLNITQVLMRVLGDVSAKEIFSRLLICRATKWSASFHWLLVFIISDRVVSHLPSLPGHSFSGQSHFVLARTLFTRFALPRLASRHEIHFDRFSSEFNHRVRESSHLWLCALVCTSGQQSYRLAGLISCFDCIYRFSWTSQQVVRPSDDPVSISCV